MRMLRTDVVQHWWRSDCRRKAGRSTLLWHMSGVCYSARPCELNCLRRCRNKKNMLENFYSQILGCVKGMSVQSRCSRLASVAKCQDLRRAYPTRRPVVLPLCRLTSVTFLQSLTRAIATPAPPQQSTDTTAKAFDCCHYFLLIVSHHNLPQPKATDCQPWQFCPRNLYHIWEFSKQHLCRGAASNPRTLGPPQLCLGLQLG